MSTACYLEEYGIEVLHDNITTLNEIRGAWPRGPWTPALWVVGNTEAVSSPDQEIAVNVGIGHAQSPNGPSLV